MSGTKVAYRYAKSLLELAIEQNNVDAVLQNMIALENVTKENLDFQLLLKSPVVNSDKKISVFRAVFDGFETLTNAFIDLITSNGRESYLADIASSFIALVKEHKGIVPVTLTSAVALDGQTKKNILDRLKLTIQGELEVTEKINPELIGGFILNMGDKQIDASIASQFSNLKQRLTR